MQLVIVHLKNGTNYEMRPEHLKVYPSGDLEYQQAVHGSCMGRIYNRNARGVIRANEVRQTNFY